MKRLSRALFVAVSMVLIGVCVHAQVDEKLFSDMKWREIGPMRAGRTRALAGVPSEPATFYLGAVNGGVWKTTDAGSTWHSVWDKESSGSIGSIAVSLSDPNTIYAGSGEGLQRPDLSTGDGVYKSTDAGKTWTHLEGLRDGQQIGQIAIDPKDANRVFVAVEGHPFGPNEERGLYRTDRWRQDVQARSVCERQDGRVGGADRSAESPDCVCGDVAAAGSAVGERVVWRRRGRTVSLDRWRRHVEEADGQRAAG